MMSDVPRVPSKFCVCCVVGAMLSSVQPTTSNAPEDIYLKCNGTVTTFAPSKGAQNLGEEEITAHIANGKISFSGSHVLLGKDIGICTLDDDEPSFDSQTCGGKVDLDKERQYGTYNKITGAMNLTGPALGERCAARIVSVPLPLSRSANLLPGYGRIA